MLSINSSKPEDKKGENVQQNDQINKQIKGDMFYLFLIKMQT